MIYINKTVSISEVELHITASRSSGPGGQNVNKVSTKVTLHFNLEDSPSLDSEQKKRIHKNLKNIISSEGYIVIHEESHRTQAANRKAVLEKFASLISKALFIPKKRIPTSVSRAQKQKRIEDKKLQGFKKNIRRKIK